MDASCEITGLRVTGKMTIHSANLTIKLSRFQAVMEHKWQCIDLHCRFWR